MNVQVVRCEFCDQSTASWTSFDVTSCFHILVRKRRKYHEDTTLGAEHGYEGLVYMLLCFEVQCLYDLEIPRCVDIYSMHAFRPDK